MAAVCVYDDDDDDDDDDDINQGHTRAYSSCC